MRTLTFEYKTIATSVEGRGTPRSMVFSPWLHPSSPLLLVPGSNVLPHDLLPTLSTSRSEDCPQNCSLQDSLSCVPGYY